MAYIAMTMVVNAQNGIEAGTDSAGRQAAKNNTPLIFAINHLEHDNSNFDDVVNQLRHSFGGGVTLIS